MFDPLDKTILGVAAMVIGFVGYVPYVRDVLYKTTKPHAFSWFTWGLLETIAFAAQMTKGAGAGAWVTAVSAIITLGIAAAALPNARQHVRLLDFVAFLGALAAIVLWRATHNPLLAVVSVATADALAFAPTFRKAYHKPNEETLFEYGASAVKWGLAIPALAAVNLTTVLYPASLVLTNSAFVLMVLSQRNATKKT